MILTALDPTLHAACSEDHVVCSMQNTQIISLSNQVYDTQAMLKPLHNHLAKSEREWNTGHADHAEMLSLLRNEREQTWHN